METALDILYGFIAGLVACGLFALAERVFVRPVLAGCGIVIVYTAIFWTVFVGVTAYYW